MANNSDSASEVQHTKEGVNTPPPFVQIDVNPLGVFNSVPQYSEPALESGIHVLPSRYSETTFIPDLPEVLGPSTPVGDPQSDSRSINSELYGNYENIDNLPSVGQEAHGDSVYSEEHDADPPRSTDPQEVLLRIKEQASAHVRAQKNQHIRDLALKKLKLQQLLLKLDTITDSEDPLSGSQYSLEEEELLSMVDSGVEGRAPLGSEDRQREGEDESNTEDRDECDHAMHRSRQMMHSCWRRIFQAIGFPLSFTSVLIIELVSFISQYVVEMLIVGLVTVLGKRMIAPLFGTLYSHVIQPLARLLINISVAVRNILRPLLAVVRYTILHVALLVRSFRLVEVHSTAAQRPHSRQDV